MKLAKMLNTLCSKLGCEIENIYMSEGKTETLHSLRHRFCDEVVIPVIAISNNYEFFLYDATKKIRTADGVDCVVSSWEEKHICDLEDDIRRLYDKDAWEFVKIWHNCEPCMTSMQFVKMKLKKI